MEAVTSRDSMTLGEALERLSPAREPSGYVASRDNYPSLQWDLNTNFPQAVTLAHDGWREKAQELERMMVHIQDLAPQGFSFSRDVSGECVDVGAYLSGEPECMIAVEPPPVRAVTLVVNSSARCSADARLLLYRGIAIASLVYSLQAQSYGVSLRIAEWVSSRTANGLHQTMIEINQAGEYLDPARLAFWLGHPAVLRRCIFRFNEQQPSKIREQYGFHESGGYGMPENLPGLVAKGDEQLREAIVVPFPDSHELDHYTTPEKALERIATLVAAQGLQIHR